MVITDIIRTLTENVGNARGMIARLPGILRTGEADRVPCPQGCDHALEFAIMTAREKRDPALLESLATVAGRVL